MSKPIFDRNPMPKRRKFKDNPYTIFTVGHASDLHYYLSFVDNRGVSICMEISKQLFEAFDQFERDDLSYMNEMDRHYERLELSDIALWRRAVKSIEPIEDSIERKMLLHSALDILTPTQRRRLCLRHLYGLRCEEIAAMEGCSIQSVSGSIKMAEKKIKKFLSTP